MLITGVSQFEQLDFTARSWLNLAWETAIKEVEGFLSLEDVLYIEDDKDINKKRAYQVFWENASFRLNNSLSLLQQGMEIALKARIARVSPFLLIAGDPQSWSKVDQNGNVEFSDLRTIDAAHLVKAANAVSDQRLDQKFTDVYERTRRNRNKIQHLDGSVIKNEGGAVLTNIMTCQRHLYPNETWVHFRRTYLEQEDADSLLMMQIDSYARSTLMHEISSAFRVMSEAQVIEFFDFDLNKDAHPCPSCLATLRNPLIFDHPFCGSA